MKKHAFTLAEILIVLTIIGVMAVMTIPSLIQNSNSQQKIALFKKGFNAISNAYATEFATKTPPRTADENNRDGGRKMLEGLANQLNVKYYALQSNYTSNTTYTKQFEKPTGEYQYGLYWIVTEDGIGYRVGAIDGKKACPTKLELNEQTSTAKIFNIAGMAILIDANGPFNGPNVLCDDGIDINNLSTCDRVHVFQTSEGITAGNPDCTISGRIISGVNPRPAYCDED